MGGAGRYTAHVLGSDGAIPLNRTQLQQLARERLLEAKALLAAKRWSGAYYLAGYAVECALKACIAKRVQAEDFPDRKLAQDAWTHNIENLVIVAGLKDARNADVQANPIFSSNWATVAGWTESSRYEFKSKGEAQALYDAITDAKHGVLQWVKLHW